MQQLSVQLVRVSSLSHEEVRPTRILGVITLFIHYIMIIRLLCYKTILRFITQQLYIKIYVKNVSLVVTTSDGNWIVQSINGTALDRSATTVQGTLSGVS